MKHENKERTPPEITIKLLKVSTIIGMVGTIAAFVLVVLAFLDDRPEKGIVEFGSLMLLVLLYTILSRRAYRTAVSRNMPGMRNLVIVTLFNLLVLGLPIGVLGTISMYFGIKGLVESPLFGISFLLLALCAILFFVAHLATLLSAVIMGRSKSAPTNL